MRRTWCCKERSPHQNRRQRVLPHPTLKTPARLVRNTSHKHGLSFGAMLFSSNIFSEADSCGRGVPPTHPPKRLHMGTATWLTPVAVTTGSSWGSSPWRRPPWDARSWLRNEHSWVSLDGLLAQFCLLPHRLLDSDARQPAQALECGATSPRSGCLPGKTSAGEAFQFWVVITPQLAPGSL